jgi:hypothetical protein
MGYSVDIACDKVVIPAAKVQDCLRAVNGLFTPEALKALKENAPFGHYSWVDDLPEGGFQHLFDAFAAWRYEAYNRDGDVCLRCFTGEKWGNDEVLFNAIAPFVQEGGEIRCIGEGNYQWKYVFKGGKCRELEGKVVYEDVE